MKVDSLRIIAYILIAYGIIGLILVRTGVWKSPPVDTFYYAFAFGLYLDVRVGFRDLRKDMRDLRKDMGVELRNLRELIRSGE
jgi:hypothetical protein